MIYLNIIKYMGNKFSKDVEWNYNFREIITIVVGGASSSRANMIHLLRQTEMK